MRERRITNRKETILVLKVYNKRRYEYSKQKVKSFGGVREERGFPEGIYPKMITFKNGKRKLIPPNHRKRKYYQGRVDRILHQ
jgi:hypothetical protein